jgi:hypothetical protein
MGMAAPIMQTFVLAVVILLAHQQEDTERYYRVQHHHQGRFILQCTAPPLVMVATYQDRCQTRI